MTYGLTFVPSTDTPPVPRLVEPLGLEELRLYLRIDADDRSQDMVIEDLQRSAREYAERWLGAQLITQRWIMTLDGFPADGVIELPKVPLQSVVSVEYTDTDLVETTLATTDYVVDTGTKPGRLIKAYGIAWPTAVLQPGGLAITYDAGHGGPAGVPQTIKQAMRLMISLDYEKRSASKPEMDRVHDLLRLNWDGSYR